MQAFHRIGRSLGVNARLEIEWFDGLEGQPLDPPQGADLDTCTQESDPDAFGTLGIPAICWRDDGDSLFEPLQLRENTEYLIDVQLPMSPEEATVRWHGDRAWPLSTVRNAYESEPPRRWKITGETVTVTGRLNFRSYVGAAELAVESYAPVRVEVVCTKIGYFDDFRLLMDSIAEEYTSLLLEIEAPTFARFTVADASPAQTMTFLFLLRHAMDESRLPAAIESILASPRSTLSQHERTMPIGLQGPYAGDSFIDRIPQGALVQGGPLQDLFRGYTPTVVPETLKRESTDNPENRYVKAFLQNVRDAAEDLRDLLSAHDKAMLARQVDVWALRMSEWLEAPLWNDVRRMTHFPSNSQALQKAPGYREVLSTDFRIQLGLSLPWSADSQMEADVRGDLRPVSQLYEYWCFFFLRSVLRSVCGGEIESQQSLIREAEDGLSVVLRRGTESRLRFRYQDAEGRSAVVSLFYNRRFVRSPAGSTAWNGSYSANLNPDFSILIDVVADAEEDRVHWLHFDAKYRLDVDQWRSEITDNLEELPRLEAELATNDEDRRISATYKRADLFKMHTYRDALLGSRGSYVLFPGSEHTTEVFIRYPGIEGMDEGRHIPGVGAFQANPSRQNLQSQQVAQFITRCIERLVRGAGYQEETGIIDGGTDDT